MTATNAQVAHYQAMAREAKLVLALEDIYTGATSYVARCGRATTHGGHMFAGGMCVGNKAEPIVQTGCTCHVTDTRCAYQDCAGRR